MTLLSGEQRKLLQMDGCMDGCRIVASVIIPPVGVFLKVGLGLHFWLNILLTLAGYIPGLVHDLWIIARKD
jgi:uncharacterized membrane protein YqaE (UPF0057 family)